MAQKKSLLFLLSAAIVLLVCNIPFYKFWIYNRIIAPGDNGTILYQMGHLDEEERREARFGEFYSFYKDIATQLKETHENITILLPPNEYVHAMHFEGIEIPEPAVFYYFTSINAVTQNSPNVQGANWALIALNGKVFMNRIKTPQQLDTLLTLYKPYKD